MRVRVSGGHELHFGTKAGTATGAGSSLALFSDAQFKDRFGRSFDPERDFATGMNAGSSSSSGFNGHVEDVTYMPSNKGLFFTFSKSMEKGQDYRLNWMVALAR